MAKSSLEDALAAEMERVGIPPPEREYRFAPPRRWRFDFAWPDMLIAVEVQGGNLGGGHFRYYGYENDCEKANQAAVMGWTLLHFTGAMIKDGRALSAIISAFRPLLATERNG